MNKYYSHSCTLSFEIGSVYCYMTYTRLWLCYFLIQQLISLRSHARAILFMANKPGNGGEISCRLCCFLFCILWAPHASPYFYARVCVCVCVNVKRAIFWISSLKQGQKSGGHANVRLVSHEQIRIFVLRNISSTPSHHTSRRV